MQVNGVGAQYAALLNTQGAAKAAEGSGGFQNVLSDAIAAANETDVADKLGSAGLLTGDVNNLHDAVIETEKADIALRLTVQIRNKIIDAYTEIMRMQV